MFCCKFILVPGDAELHTLKVDDFIFRKLGRKFAPMLPLSNYPNNVYVNVEHLRVEIALQV